jgi:hypothetical protein
MSNDTSPLDKSNIDTPTLLVEPDPVSTPRELVTAHEKGEFLTPTLPNEEDELFYKYSSEDMIKHLQSDENKAILKQKSVFLELLKQIKPGVELYRISIPTFILHPVSLLERISSTSVMNSCMNNWEGVSAEFRMLKIVGWLTAQFRNIPREGIDGSKPYNPIRGEIFNCSWDYDDKSTTHFTGEQVSHHPPISAFYSYNVKKGIVFDGFMEPKTSFSIGSAATNCVGRYTVRGIRLGEVYNCVMASVTATGLLWGKKEIVVTGDLTVSCQKTGLDAKVTFGSKNKISGVVTKEKEKLFIIDGVLTEHVKVQNVATKQIYMLYDLKTLVQPPIKVVPLVNQVENESRRIWHPLTAALSKQDYDKATIQKLEIEDSERKKEDERKKKGEPWAPKLFKSGTGGDWVYTLPVKDDDAKWSPTLDMFKSDLDGDKLKKLENVYGYLGTREMNTWEFARVTEFVDQLKK